MWGAREGCRQGTRGSAPDARSPLWGHGEGQAETDRLEAKEEARSREKGRGLSQGHGDGEEGPGRVRAQGAGGMGLETVRPGAVVPEDPGSGPDGSLGGGGRLGEDTELARVPWAGSAPPRVGGEIWVLESTSQERVDPSVKPSRCEKAQGVLEASPSWRWMGVGDGKRAQKHLGIRGEVRSWGSLPRTAASPGGEPGN